METAAMLARMTAEITEIELICRQLCGGAVVGDIGGPAVLAPLSPAPGSATNPGRPTGRSAARSAGPPALSPARLAHRNPEYEVTLKERAPLRPRPATERIAPERIDRILAESAALRDEAREKYHAALKRKVAEDRAAFKERELRRERAKAQAAQAVVAQVASIRAGTAGSRQAMGSVSGKRNVGAVAGPSMSHSAARGISAVSHTSSGTWHGQREPTKSAYYMQIVEEKRALKIMGRKPRPKYEPPKLTKRDKKPAAVAELPEPGGRQVDPLAHLQRKNLILPSLVHSSVSSGHDRPLSERHPELYRTSLMATVKAKERIGVQSQMVSMLKLAMEHMETAKKMMMNQMTSPAESSARPGTAPEDLAPWEDELAAAQSPASADGWPCTVTAIQLASPPQDSLRADASNGRRMTQRTDRLTADEAAQDEAEDRDGEAGPVAWSSASMPSAQVVQSQAQAECRRPRYKFERSPKPAGFVPSPITMDSLEQRTKTVAIPPPKMWKVSQEA